MTYAPWKKYFSKDIELVFLEMQGRGIKSDQKISYDISIVVDSLFQEIKDDISGEEYIIFGHSMGSLLAYELYYKIEAEGFKLPTAVVLSGRMIPELCVQMKNVSDYPDADFLNEVAIYGGLPDEITSNKDLRDYFVPILRADFKLIESYTYPGKREKIGCKLIVLYGSEDYTTPPDRMMEWRKKARIMFLCIEVPGDHFFCMDEKNSKNISNIIQKIFTQD